eukprot:41589-Prymnesium_polylepis.1
MDLSLVDDFLRWEAGQALLAMGLFPNAKEISESMACMQAIVEHIDAAAVRDPSVLALVLGDGRTPRTGALLARRTRWRCISIDPALRGLVAPSGSGEQLKELRNDRDLVVADAEDAPGRRRTAAALREIERLELRACLVQDTVVDVPPSVSHVVLLLPHAH